MKIRKLLAVATAALVLSVTGCNKSDAEEKAAVENLKKEVESFDVWMKERGKAMLTDPKSAIAAMSEMVTKLKAIKIDDLPADLKSAWSDFVVKFDQMSVVMAEITGDPMATAKKALTDPAFRQNTMAKMKTITDEMKPIAERLKETGKKYGIEKFSELAPK